MHVAQGEGGGCEDEARPVQVRIDTRSHPLADDIIGHRLARASPSSFTLRAATNASPAPTVHSAAHVSGMAAASNEAEPAVAAHEEPKLKRIASNGEPAAQDSESDEEDEDEADEEPKLKYTRLTSSLAPVYRNGDATSTFLVAGDKMVWRMLQTLCERAYAEFWIDHRQP